MSQRVLPENNAPKSRTSEAAGDAEEKNNNTRTQHLITRFHSVKVNLPILSSLSLSGGSVRGGNGAGGKGERMCYNLPAPTRCACHNERAGERRERLQMVYMSVSYEIGMACIRIWASERTECSRFRMEIGGPRCCFAAESKKKKKGKEEDDDEMGRI